MCRLRTMLLCNYTHIFEAKIDVNNDLMVVRGTCAQCPIGAPYLNNAHRMVYVWFVEEEKTHSGWITNTMVAFSHLYDFYEGVRFAFLFSSLQVWKKTFNLWFSFFSEYGEIISNFFSKPFFRHTYIHEHTWHTFNILAVLMITEYRSFQDV